MIFWKWERIAVFIFVVFLLGGCAKIQVIEGSTGQPAQNFTIYSNMPNGKMKASFNVIISEEISRHSFTREYLDTYEEEAYEFDEKEAKGLFMWVRLLNPDESMYTLEIVDLKNGGRVIDKIYEGEDLDKSWSIPCPARKGSHDVIVRVMRNGKIALIVGSFRYKVVE